MFETSFETDKYGCFHISDFAVGDAVLVQTIEGRVRGLVTEVSTNACLITYKTKSGYSESHINDIAFLSSYERGWLV
jgi:hypothetical protein